MPAKDIKQRRATWNAWYHRDPAHREYYVQKNKARRARLKQQLDDYKLQLQCEECGESHIACIVFHHVDIYDKEFGIAEAMQRNYSFKRVLSEIKKCRVMCENCHRKLHYEMRCGNIMKIVI